MSGALPHAFWHGFTWLGDSGLLLPAALLIALWLLSARQTLGAALLWVLLFGAGGFAILVSKLAFMGWGLGIGAIDFTGFSGHTAIASSVWPVALWLMASRAGARWQRTAIVAGWLLGAAIGASRLALDAHSVSEVVAGLALGIAVSAAFFALQKRHPSPRLWWPLVLASLLLPLAFQKPGQPAPTQDLLEVIAMRLAGTDRAFTRADLHAGR